MECSKCGFDNPADSRFCNKCGTQITRPEEASSPVTRTIQMTAKELTPGSTFATRYQIIEELGRGGMGRVYKVLDKEIGEKVALKLLNPDIAADGDIIERFRNELKTARQISHKNVCRMYHFSKEEDTYYITMEYVRGEDLKSMLRMMGRLSPGQAIGIARQIAEGLAQAHKLDVIHRDLKPHNIMIDRDGNIKIMDFGIARSIKTKGITGTGMMIGTPEYMSPEQVEGRETDGRSDIYALGIILYEMLTGRLPFEGETALAVALKQKTESPADPRKINPQVPEDLAKLIMRCLEKEKENRFQTTEEVIAEFDRIEKGIPSAERILLKGKPLTSKEIRTRHKKKSRIIAAAALMTLCGAAAIVYFGRGKPDAKPITPRIVVLPFENLGAPEDEYFADGITDEIIARLASISQLEVIGRASAVQYEKTDKSTSQIGEELGVSYILSGTVRWQRQPEGVSKVRVTPSLVRVSDSTQIWASPYDETISEVFQVQSDIAKNVAQALNVAILGREQKMLEAKLTDSAEAYDFYLQAREYLERGLENRENLSTSIDLFEKAVRLDPGFSQAYAGLSRAHASMYWWHFDYSEERAKKSKEAADKAIQFGPDLAQAHIALGIFFYSCRLDYDRALEQLSIALEKQPNNGVALKYTAYIKRRQGKLDEVTAIQKKALEVDPRSIDITQNLGDTYALLRDYAEAERYYLRTIAISPDYLPAYISPGGSLAYLYLYGMGDTSKTIEVFKEASKKNPALDEENWLRFLWATASIFDRDYEEALRHIHSMPGDSLDDQFRLVPKSQLYAQVYGLMGDKQKEKDYYDSARSFLEKQIREKPDDSRLFSALGIVNAGLGFKEKAILEATRATEILPVSKEYWRGIYRVKDLAQVYVTVGEHDKALDQIEYLLSIPGELSVANLKIDPVWAPLRGLPRFQELVEKSQS